MLPETQLTHAKQQLHDALANYRARDNGAISASDAAAAEWDVRHQLRVIDLHVARAETYIMQTIAGPRVNALVALHAECLALRDEAEAALAS